MRYRPEDEAEILKGLVAGDRTSFETVYRRHNVAMVRMAAILRSRASAEEVTQDTWLSC